MGRRVEGRKYYQLIPERILSKFAEWEQDPPFKNFKIDDAGLLLSVIATHIRKYDSGEFYARLKMEYLRNRVYNAERYTRFFLRAGLITRFGGFKENANSYQYQFTEAYKSKLIKTELKNPKLLNKMIFSDKSDFRKTSRKYPIQKQILKKLSVDTDRAEAVARQNCQEVNELNNAIASITRINNRDWTYTIDDKIFRLHTNLTSFPKALRGELRINGKKLKGVDIGNSVPYMANKILLDPEGAKNFFPEPDKYPIMMLKSLRLTEQEDVKRYGVLTSGAKFYKYLETEFNKCGCNYNIISETKVSDDLKRKVFQIFFSANKYSCIEKRIFQRLFPNVNKVFFLLRMYRRDYLNYMLGRMESYIILDMILQHLNIKYPELYATQIYDNVISSVSDNGIVSKVMAEELTGFVGVAPTLKLENFSDHRIFFDSKAPFPSKKERGEKRRAGRGVLPYDVEIPVKN